MRSARKIQLENRLEAYFATLRSTAPAETLKRMVANWPVYAAVSGSALAMATGASAALMSGDTRGAGQPTASVRISRQPMGSSKAPPFFLDAILAGAKQDGRQKLSRGVLAARSLAAVTQAPSINAGGVVPIYGTQDIIQPGEWVTIYGQNLANTTASWNGDFPTSLGGTSVTIDGRAAYLAYVSPTQINLQAPDDGARGTVPVVVTTPRGQATAPVILSSLAPSFALLYQNYVAGLIVRSDGSGTYGGGTYDILGPTGNSFGYATVAAKPGDKVELFGVGFGPTTPSVPAGKPFSGAAPINGQISLYINHVLVTPLFVGISSAGLYQINLVVPAGLGEGAVHIHADLGGMRTQKGVLFSLQGSPAVTSTGGSTSGFFGGFGTAFSGGAGGGSFGGSGGGTAGGTGGGPGTGGGGTGGGGTGGAGTGGGGTGGGGGSGGGTGGGGSAALRRKPYQPRLRFEQDGENANARDSVQEG